MAQQQAWYRKWVNDTSIHGIKDIVEAPSLFARITWVIAFLAMFAWMLHESWIIINDYVDGKTITSTSYSRFEQDLEDHIHYMQFLYCPINDWLDFDKLKDSGIPNRAGALAIAMFENIDADLYFYEAVGELLEEFLKNAANTVGIVEHLNGGSATEENVIGYFNNPQFYNESAHELQIWLTKNQHNNVSKFLIDLAKKHLVETDEVQHVGFVRRYGRICEHVGLPSIKDGKKRVDFTFNRSCEASMITITPYYQSSILEISDQMRGEMQQLEETLDNTIYDITYMLNIVHFDFLPSLQKPCLSNINHELPTVYNMNKDCESRCLSNASCYHALETACLLERPFDDKITKKGKMLADIRKDCKESCANVASGVCNARDVQLTKIGDFTSATCLQSLKISLNMPLYKTIATESLVITWSNMLSQIGGLTGLFLGASFLSFIQIVLAAAFGSTMCHKCNKNNGSLSKNAVTY